MKEEDVIVGRRYLSKKECKLGRQYNEIIKVTERDNTYVSYSCSRGDSETTLSDFIKTCEPIGTVDLGLKPSDLLKHCYYVGYWNDGGIKRVIFRYSGNLSGDNHLINTEGNYDCSSCCQGPSIKFRYATESEIIKLRTEIDKRISNNLKSKTHEVPRQIKTDRRSVSGQAIKARRKSSRITSSERLIGNEVKTITRRGKVGGIKIRPSAFSSSYN